MKLDRQLTLRVEEAVAQRLEHLARQHGVMKATHFARLALLKGLPEVEKEYLGEAKPSLSDATQKAA